MCGGGGGVVGAQPSTLTYKPLRNVMARSFISAGLKSCHACKDGLEHGNRESHAEVYEGIFKAVEESGSSAKQSRVMHLASGHLQALGQPGKCR